MMSKPIDNKNLKADILKAFFQELDRELNTLVEAAFTAREVATHEDSKAENKYDTRGLEASYLAGAQAKRARELRETIDQLKKMPEKNYSADDPIQSQALVTVEDEQGSEKHFLIVPKEGGAKVTVSQKTYFLITPDSPIGKKLLNRKLDDDFDFVLKGETVTYQITEIS